MKIINDKYIPLLIKHNDIKTIFGLYYNYDEIIFTNMEIIDEAIKQDNVSIIKMLKIIDGTKSTMKKTSAYERDYVLYTEWYWASTPVYKPEQLLLSATRHRANRCFKYLVRRGGAPITDDVISEIIDTEYIYAFKLVAKHRQYDFFEKWFEKSISYGKFGRKYQSLNFDSTLFKFIIDHKSDKMIDIMTRTFYTLRPELIDPLIKNKHYKYIDRLLFQTSTSNSNYYKTYAESAIKYDSAEVIRRICNRGYKITNDTYSQCVIKGAINIIKDSVFSGRKLPPNLIDVAARSRRINIIDFLINNGYNTTTTTFKNACKSNDIKTITYLLKHRCPIDSTAYEELFENKNFELITLMHKNGFEFTHQDMLNAVKSDDYYILKYMHESGMEITDDMLEHAIQCDTMNTFEYMLSTGHKCTNTIINQTIDKWNYHGKHLLNKYNVQF